MARYLMRLLLAGATAFTSATAALAQGLADPMRPPPELIPPSPRSAGGFDASAPQVLVLSRQRREATVNGQVMRPGDRLNGARIEQISDAGVTVRTEDRTRQNIPMYPGIEKKAASTTSGDNRAGKGKQ